MFAIFAIYLSFCQRSCLFILVFKVFKVFNTLYIFDKAYILKENQL